MRLPIASPSSSASLLWPEFAALKITALKFSDLVGIQLGQRLFEFFDEAPMTEARGLSPRQKPAERSSGIFCCGDITFQGSWMHRRWQFAGVHPGDQLFEVGVVQRLRETGYFFQ